MASIRKRGNSYLIVVSMGYDCAGNRLKSMQQTVHPPASMTPKQTEKWLNEQAVLFELSCKQQPQQTASNMTLAEYSKYWFENIAPNKLASSTVAREKSDIDRFLPHIGHYKLTELRPEHFRKLYVALRKEKNMINGKPLSELTVEGVHACLCGILSDAVESGLLDHNPAWRTYKYSNIDQKQQVVADEEILQKLICALEKESMQGKKARVRTRDEGIAIVAVAAVRPAARHKFFPAEGHAPMPSLARLDKYFRFIDKPHASLRAGWRRTCRRVDNRKGEEALRPLPS